MSDRNKYHRKALRCVRTAKTMHDPGERATLLEIARAYLGLARHVAERNHRGIVHGAHEHDLPQLEDA